MRILILSLLLITHVASAENISYNFESYKEAKKSKSFISFEMKSTKLGLFTTTFTAYVKKFDATYEKDETGYKHVKVKLSPLDIDTDINARNEKMNEVCFESSKYPEIAIEIAQLPIGQNTVDATLFLRGEPHPIKISTDVSISNTEESVQGEVTLLMSQLKIPDPSIAIAKVKDEVKVQFHLLKNNN